MGPAGRLFRCLVLASVLLNLGDAPYVDEIFGDLPLAQSHGVSISVAPDEDTQAPDTARASRAISVTYQLLVSCLAVVGSCGPVLEVVRLADARPTEDFLAFSSLPPGRIDRPPRYDSRSI